MGKDKRDCMLLELLKICAKNKDLYKGTELHEEALKKGFLETNPYVASALISMYAKCGALEEAQQVLETLAFRDIISWNALIAGYTQHGHGHAALACFDKLQNEFFSPTQITLTCILKACGITGDIEKGKQIHYEIVHRGLLEGNIMLGNALVDMYAKCGSVIKAQEAIEELQNRDVVSWSTLIGAYAQNGEGHKALEAFSRMQREGLSPNEVTFACVLKACGSIGAIYMGKQIHVHIIGSGIIMESNVVATALVDMYGKCGVLTKAQQTFEEIHHRNQVSWNTLISGYVRAGQGCEALNCCEKMKIEGLSPNDSTFICLLKACGSIGTIHKGKQIHEEIAKIGLLNKNTVVGTALVDMYVKCGVLGKAKEVLEELYIRDVVSWNVLIAGYVSELGQGHEALNCYSQMRREGLSPNDITFNCILKACGSTRSIEKGKQIHNEILSRGLVEKNIWLGTSMVDMYTKCSMLAKAHEVLRSLPFRDIVAWNALITGYAQEGKGHEVLDCYAIMKEEEGLRADEVTFTCVLKACGCIGAVNEGKHIHDEIVKSGLLVNNFVLGGGLVDMYAKCGMLAKAQEVLRELPSRDTVSWSALIGGYAEKGHYAEASHCFQEMQREGYLPNEITLLCMLNACSHSGKVDEAQTHYENMSELYGIKPLLEHHTCMVVIYGCSGRFEKAMSVIKRISSRDPSAWLTLLYSCKKWGNVSLGRLIFNQMIQLENSLAAAYTLMHDIYAAAGMQQDAEKIEEMKVDSCLENKATMKKHVS